jgi:glycosyltransferase involved in cell wall biosynthesis
MSSPHRLKYLLQLKQSLNELTHKIAMARKLDEQMHSAGGELQVAYTYWFNQWTFILSVLHKLKPSFKLFTRIHGSDVYEEQHTEPGFFFKFRTFQFRAIKKVFAISANGKKHLLKMNPGLEENKITVSRLGVEDHGHGREEQNAGYRIVSCSALQRYKRVHLIVEILKYIKEPVEWVHFGDGELRDNFLEQVKQLPAHITFKWMGFQPNSAVTGYYKENAVDLFINVSETEGIPVSIMEAISFGVPVMATDVGGVSEIVNSATGYLIPKQFDVKAAAEQISEHFHLPAGRKGALRRSTRDFWTEHYNAVRNYESLYTELTNA